MNNPFGQAVAILSMAVGGVAAVGYAGAALAAMDGNLGPAVQWAEDAIVGAAYASVAAAIGLASLGPLGVAIIKALSD